MQQSSKKKTTAHCLDKCGHLTVYGHRPTIHSFLKRLYLTSLENCDDRHGHEGLEFVKTQTNIKFRRRCHMAPLMSSCALMLSLRLPDADIYNLFVSQKNEETYAWAPRSPSCAGTQGFPSRGFSAPLTRFRGSDALRCDRHVV